MGKRSKRERQEELWIAKRDIVETPGHVFYDRLNELLGRHRFDERVEHLCRRFYQGPYGRPSIAPGVYFRMMLVGYFEGLDSERGIAWRVADSLSLRNFLGYGLDEKTPDHSTISRTRRLYWLSTHQAVFRWALGVLAAEGLVRGETVSIDATTLEANAALRSIVRRENGQRYEEYLRRLAEEEGIEEPTREQLARFDRKRKKKGSNRDWKHPQDPDARITRMKDGRTHLAYKAEHAVDLSSGAVVAVTLQPADAGDPTTLFETLRAAQAGVEGVGSGKIKELVADKGYHSNGVLVRLKEEDVRSYVSEPERGRRRWKGKRVAQKGGIWESSSASGRAEQAAPVQARRVERTKFRSHVRDRRHETPPLERPTEHPETAARPRCRLRPVAPHAHVLRCWQAPAAPGPRGPSLRCTIPAWTGISSVHSFDSAPLWDYCPSRPRPRTVSTHIHSVQRLLMSCSSATG